jgi:hypothetical protein
MNQVAKNPQEPPRRLFSHYQRSSWVWLQQILSIDRRIALSLPRRMVREIVKLLKALSRAGQHRRHRLRARDR